jgi:cell division protein ZapA
MSNESIVIQILGRDYQVSVKPEEKEALQEAVVLVSEKLQQLIGKNSSGSESTAVMCALMIAHESALARRTASLDMPAYRRRIELLTEQIDKLTAV